MSCGVSRHGPLEVQNSTGKSAWIFRWSTDLTITYTRLIVSLQISLSHLTHISELTRSNLHFKTCKAHTIRKNPTPVKIGGAIPAILPNQIMPRAIIASKTEITFKLWLRFIEAAYFGSSLISSIQFKKHLLDRQN